MGSQVRIRHVAALGLLLVGLSLVVLVVPTDALAAELRDGLLGVAAADMRWLAATVLLLAASLTGTALAWRAALRACDVPCRRVDAVARYGVGSLANAVLPTRIGGVLRIALFSRLVAVEGAVWTTGGAAAVAGVARSLWLAALVALASTGGLLPAWPAVVLLGLGSLGAGAALVASRTRHRARAAHILDAFRALSDRPRAAVAVLGCVGAAIFARVAAASALAVAFGVGRPLAAGILAVAAIEVVGLLPLSIGGAGMAGGAVAFALAAHGAAAGVPASAGIAFAAAETAIAVVVGGVGGVVLAFPLVSGWLVRPVPVAIVSLADE